MILWGKRRKEDETSRRTRGRERRCVHVVVWSKGHRQIKNGRIDLRRPKSGIRNNIIESRYNIIIILLATHCETIHTKLQTSAQEFKVFESCSRPHDR